jgi:branched-chain amino acid transport system permease protein
MMPAGEFREVQYSFMDPIFFQTCINGLILGSLYLLVALGLTLIFSIMGIINFAHGEIFMLGGFATFFLREYYAVNFFLSLALSMGILAAFGILIERMIFRPLRGEALNLLVISLGLSIVLQNLALIFWGPEEQSYLIGFQGVIKIFGMVFSKERLVAFTISALLVVGLYLFIGRTKTGKALQAVAQDSEAAALQGISINQINALTFGIGCALAAAAGSTMGPIFLVSPFMGMMPVVKAFIIIMLGGLGSVIGAVAGGLILGIAESFGATYLGATFQNMVGFILLMSLLIFKPLGLFGYHE